jgi:hypothetical protein
MACSKQIFDIAARGDYEDLHAIITDPLSKKYLTPFMFFAACYGGNFRTVDMVLRHVETSSHARYKTRYKVCGLYGASLGQHASIFRYILDHPSEIINRDSEEEQLIFPRIFTYVIKNMDSPYLNEDERKKWGVLS